ncbi:MAG TPA: transglycosylase family protein [Candidatus Saccharimonadales bacterium]|nr:transglycosylase family protein [Candidatus Saccharimonadales bacterium]
MYTLHKLITWFMILISPARMIAALPIIIPTSVSAQSAQTNAPYHLTLDTSTPQAITVHVPAQPNFDTDVLAPLRAEQAAEAAAAAQAQAQAQAAAVAAEAARVAAQAATAPAVSAPAGDAAFQQLTYCEAGGDYTRNSGNGYFGAYQYSLATWNDYDGYARPDLAPASVQDARAHADVARRGWSAWPACARKLGLL